jgi:PqqD family protein of HPr-rel-A system
LHSETVYTASPSILLHDLEEASACYDQRTGETHMLGVFPAAVLAQLGELPLTLAELARVTADLCGATDDADWRDKVSTTLYELQKLSLVQCRSPCD